MEEDWCLSVLRSYQAEHGPEFPWSVGKESWARRAWEGQEEGEYSGPLFEHLLSAGEDMSADGRRQLALFLVS